MIAVIVSMLVFVTGMLIFKQWYVPALLCTLLAIYLAERSLPAR